MIKASWAFLECQKSDARVDFHLKERPNSSIISMLIRSYDGDVLGVVRVPENTDVWRVPIRGSEREEREAMRAKVRVCMCE